jgi:hypothetical protein
MSSAASVPSSPSRSSTPREPQGTWTTAKGDSLEVTYAGQVFLTRDPDFPFGFDAALVASGGTGRFADAQGQAAMTGAFTGVPGDFVFAFEGTLAESENSTA